MRKFRSYLTAIAAVMLCAGGVSVAPTAGANVCGSVGGRHFDVSGCSDPLYELNDALAPPPPPGAPPPAYVPPPPPAPNVSVCANVGRRISVSGCV
ncbi:RNA-binding protein [Mycobacterium sp. NPDC003449]